MLVSLMESNFDYVAGNPTSTAVSGGVPARKQHIHVKSLQV